MVVTPKWQTMWLRFHHQSRRTLNLTEPSQLAVNLLEDIKTSCSSPNKSIQLGALKCWGAWIDGQKKEDLKLSRVCCSAVRPLFLTRLQPLNKDADICKLKFSLLWALIRKVQNLMRFDGPQYILEIFLQSCLNGLTSWSVEEKEEITELIFQLLLGLFSEEINDNICDKNMFPPLSVNIFTNNKIFSCIADKFVLVFLYWKKIQPMSAFLKLWRNFLEHCELSHQHIPVNVWHSAFKFVSDVCSEKSEPVEIRLELIHSCATIIKSVLSSSKFVGFESSLMTPCEALLKKFMDLCRSECEEFCDAKMFIQGLETSKALSMESVAICGYDLNINVLNLLEEFSLRSLYWGVWCGLVHCYDSLLSHVDQSDLTKTQKNFYRKLRGFAINFELDKNYLGENCVVEVERCIQMLNVNLSPCRSSEEIEAEKYDKEVETEQPVESPETAGTSGGSSESSEVVDPTAEQTLGEPSRKSDSGTPSGRFPARKRAKQSQPQVININFDLANHSLETVNVSCPKPSLGNDFRFRFTGPRGCDRKFKSKCLSFPSFRKNLGIKTVKAKVSDNASKKANACPEEKSETSDEETNVPKTRSQKRAVEEIRRKRKKNQKGKKRKSFEARVQEIVQKNKERKTEKNCGKPPVISPKEKRKRFNEKNEETFEEKLKKRNKKEKSPCIANKLEGHFQAVTKNSNDCRKKDSPKERRRENAEVGWRQTSPRTMMRQERETENERMGIRRKKKKVAGGKMKKRMEGGPHSKKSIFKEVFHDHEPVSVNERSEKKKQINEVKQKEINLKLKKLKRKRRKVIAELKKLKLLASETGTSPTPEIQKFREPKTTVEATPNVKNVSEGLNKSKELSSADFIPEAPELEECFETEAERPSVSGSFTEAEKATKGAATESNKLETATESNELETATESNELETATGIQSVVDAAATEPQSKNLLLEAENDCEIMEIIPRTESFPKEQKPNSDKEVAEVLNKPIEKSEAKTESSTNMDEEKIRAILESTVQRAKKRFQIFDSLKSNKKLKSESPQEKVALDVEKENLKEDGPVKEDKSSKLPPRVMTGMISSRALKMIALVPELPRSQMHWETPAKVEVKKKGFSVDRSSRASKMLALLENARKTVELKEPKVAEVKSNGGLKSTTVKTPLKTLLKSEKTVKQRRSIKFDDARNETVVYETDTPPSRVLDGKDKSKGIQSSEVKLPIFSIP